MVPILKQVRNGSTDVSEMISSAVLPQVYHVPDPAIIGVAAFGGFLRSLVFIVSGIKSHLYIGGFLDLFNLAGLVACRCTIEYLRATKPMGMLTSIAFQGLCFRFGRGRRDRERLLPDGLGPDHGTGTVTAIRNALPGTKTYGL